MNQQASSEVGQLALRIVLLATLLFAVNAWVVRHLGLGFGEFALINSFIGFVYLSIGVLAKGQEESFNEAVRHAFTRALTLPVLLALYMLVLVLTSFVSSVTILAAGESGDISARLTAEGRPPDESTREVVPGPDGMVRYWRFISPFGSSFYLLADGYLRQPLQVRPWIGATVRLSELIRLPSILLRIPYQKHGALQASVLRIQLETGEQYNIELAAFRASVLLGRDEMVPVSIQEAWRSELRTLSDAPEALRESIFRNWIEPLRVESIPALSPGLRVRVTFTTIAGKEVAGRSFTVGSSAFQDVLLMNSGD